MMKVVYSDVHLGALHELDLFEQMMEESATAILMGDICDFKGVHPNKLKILKEKHRMLKEAYKERYVSGNHECGEGPNSYFYQSDEILFHHSHTTFWKYDRVNSWQKREIGSNHMMRYLSYLWYLGREYFWNPNNYTIGQKKKLLDVAEYHEVKTIVHGHLHPMRQIDVNFEGIRMICVERGRTQLII